MPALYQGKEEKLGRNTATGCPGKPLRNKVRAIITFHAFLPLFLLPCHSRSRQYLPTAPHLAPAVPLLHEGERLAGVPAPLPGPPAETPSSIRPASLCTSSSVPQPSEQMHSGPLWLPSPITPGTPGQLHGRAPSRTSLMGMHIALFLLLLTVPTACSEENGQVARSRPALATRPTGTDFAARRSILFGLPHI